MSKNWAEKTIEATKISRKDTYEQIKSAGYDIQNNAEKLQEFYLKVVQS